METILHALNGVVTVMLMIAVGFILERRGWFSEDSVTLISRLVNYVCLPTYMLTNILGQFKHDQLITLSHGLIVPLISMLAGYVLSRLLGRLIGVPRVHQGIFSICVAFSNTIFIGLPLGIALFGDAGAPYIMIYYMVNTTLFWTIGFRDLAVGSEAEMPLLSKKTLKSIISPPLMGFMLGVVMVLGELSLPEAIFKSCRYLGSMTTPLAMLFIGIAMSKTDWKEITLGKELVAAMLGRYLICPVIVFLILPFFHLDPMMEKVFVIMAAMPAMTNTAIVAKSYGGDYKYAAMLTAVSTVLAVIAIPFYMWLVHYSSLIIYTNAMRINPLDFH